MNVRAVVCLGVTVMTTAACGRGVETRSAGDPPAGSSGRATSSSATMAPPTTSTTSATSTTTSSGPEEESPLVAYAFEQDVWLYDGRSGRVERLTSDGGERTDHSPRFRDRRRLTFVSMSANKDDSTLVEVDPARGNRRNLLRHDNAVWAYDWTADGSTLVYVASVTAEADDGSFRHELRRVAADGSRTTLRRFDGLFGRDDDVAYDEVRVDWSADGSSLLLVDTHLDVVPGEPKTVFVLRPDGTNLTAPRRGNWARWTGNADTVVYVDGAGGVGTLSTTTGSTTPLPTTGPARRLAVSPDGRTVAYDDDAADPAVYVYDLARRTGRRVAGHAVGALWLSRDVLAAGHATPCSPTATKACDGWYDTPWTETGDGWRIDVTTGTVETVPIASTMDAAVG